MMARLYQLRDIVAGAPAGQIFVAHNDEEAKRSFFRACRELDEKAIPARDLVLLFLGEQEDSGKLVPLFGDPGYSTIAVGREPEVV